MVVGRSFRHRTAKARGQGGPVREGAHAGRDPRPRPERKRWRAHATVCVRLVAALPPWFPSAPRKWAVERPGFV